MRGEAIPLGPFSAGLNTVADHSAVPNDALVTCDNFEVALDGSLQSRPPIIETTTSSGSGTTTIIGSAILAGGTYIFASNDSGTYYKTDSGSWTLLVANLKARVALQYNDNVYIPAITGSAVNGGRWDGTTWTTDALMPKGEAAVFYKSRLFICPGILSTTNRSRLQYSDIIVAAGLTWTASNFIDVSPGDGTALIDLAVYNDNLLLFKQASTFVLSYDTAISGAVLRELNSEIGCTTYRCMVAHETSIFVYHEGVVYEIVNYNFSRLNIRVPFTYDATVPSGYSSRVHEVFMCSMGDRLITRYYNRIYAFNLLSKAWSTWSSASTELNNFGPLVELPSNPTQYVNKKYYAGSCLNSNLKVFTLYDGWDSSKAEGETFAVYNHSTNPSFEVDTTGWSTAGAFPPAIARSSTTAFNGSWSLKITWSGAGGSFPLVSHVMSGLTVGRSYKVKCKVKRLSSSAPRLLLVMGGLGVGATSPAVTNVWSEITYTFTATSTSHNVQVWPNSTTVAGDTYVDGVVVYDTEMDTKLETVPDYWDGNSTNGTWTGTAGKSTSHVTQLQNLTIYCNIQTKNYDFAVPQHYKKLAWWGADIHAKGDVSGTAQVVVYSFDVLWSQIANTLWADLEDNLWGHPIDGLAPTTTAVAGVNDSLSRKFVKFLKALRFRQIYFKLTLKTNGTTLTGPCRVYTLSAIVGGKQLVEAQVN